jgi:uncharacterized protein (DUF1499 family)
MFPFAWLIGLLLPACAATGAAGLAVPPPMDFSRFVRPATPNTALAGPAVAGLPSPGSPVPGSPVPGSNAVTAVAPDLVTPVFRVSAARLFAAVHEVAAAQPRTFLAASYPDRLQEHWVARSAVFNFPDLIAVQVAAAGPDTSTLVLYSRSVYGRSDLGVNLARLRVWLAAVNTMLMSPTERDEP